MGPYGTIRNRTVPCVLQQWTFWAFFFQNDVPFCTNCAFYDAKPTFLRAIMIFVNFCEEQKCKENGIWPTPPNFLIGSKTIFDLQILHLDLLSNKKANINDNTERTSTKHHPGAEFFYQNYKDD